MMPRNMHETRYSASDQVAVLIICLLYTFSSREIPFKCNYVETFDVSCGMFSYVIISNAISLILSDMDSENISLIQHSVSNGQKTCSSKGVLLMGIY